MEQGEYAKPIIINIFDFIIPDTFDSLIGDAAVREHPNNINNLNVLRLHSTLRESLTVEISKEFRNNYSQYQNLVMGNVSKFKIAFLNASSRLEIAKTSNAGSPNSPPQNLLQALYKISNKQTDEQLQKVFNLAFDMDIKLDYSELISLSFRVAKTFDYIPPDPREAYPEFSKYPKLDSQGDGFRSFVEIVLSLLLCRDRIILLDEPEAFLHPTQIRVLGNWIGTYSSTTENQIIIATHNANLLNGISGSNAKVDIYRLNRFNNKTTFTKVSSENTNKLAKFPLLSSQPVLEALFYKGVIICESDADRSLYQSVEVSKLNNENVLFIHAYGKGNIKDIVPIIRQASIPVRVIVDVDILDSRIVFEGILSAISPWSRFEDLISKRDKIAKIIEGKDEKEIIKDMILELESFIDKINKESILLSNCRILLNNICEKASK